MSCFVQTYLKAVPEGLDKADRALIRKRRRETIKTMEAMSVLDMVGSYPTSRDNKRSRGAMSSYAGHGAEDGDISQFV